MLTSSLVPRCLGLIAALLLQACASTEPAQSDGKSTHAQTQLVWNSGQTWEVFNLPGKRKTQFALHQQNGQDVILAQAASSASMLRHKLHIAPEDLNQVRFSWKVPALIEAADISQRDSDDSPVRLVLAFEGDRSQFSLKNRMMSELSLALTGEEMPYATLMYVWSGQHPTGSVIHNPRTDRIRKIVIESGSAHLGRWVEYERDIRADFIQAFGEAPGALVGIALMTDTDNTQSQASAWYGPVKLSNTPTPKTGKP